MLFFISVIKIFFRESFAITKKLKNWKWRVNRLTSEEMIRRWNPTNNCHQQRQNLSKQINALPDPPSVSTNVFLSLSRVILYKPSTKWTNPYFHYYYFYITEKINKYK
jgi:hypothetical protein